jgi:hypothetical protein
MLKRLDNGRYEVKNMKQAKEALEGVRRLNGEISELMKEHGINDLMEDVTEMKKAATYWADSNDIDVIKLDGARAQLRKDKYGGTWVSTGQDLDGAPLTAVPLLEILRRKIKNATERREIWQRITKRVVDPERLEQAVKEGTLTADEIAPAYYEKEKAAYLRIYEE